MPKKGPIAGSNDFAMIRTLDGHRSPHAREWYDDKTEEQIYADISDARGLSSPTRTINDRAAPDGPGTPDVTYEED